MTHDCADKGLQLLLLPLFFLLPHGTTVHCEHKVFVHALQKVDMRGVVGHPSSTSLAISGGTADRQVVCYSSHPDELQAVPQSLVLPAKTVYALALNFRPLHPGCEWVSAGMAAADGVFRNGRCTLTWLPATEQSLSPLSLLSDRKNSSGVKITDRNTWWSWAAATFLLLMHPEWGSKSCRHQFPCCINTLNLASATDSSKACTQLWWGRCVL